MRVILVILYIVTFAICEDKPGQLNQQPLESPVNLTHALSLVDSIEVDGEVLYFIWIYADAPSYKPVAAPGEGIACVDDVGRFMEVLETEILTYQRRELLPIAVGMTRFLLYMSREDGLWYNFIYQDGSINRTHQNSKAEFGWWAIRGLRGLAAADKILTGSPEHKSLLTAVEERIRTADRHIEAALHNYPEQIMTSLGLRPKWLVKNAPDMNSELLLALTKLQESGKFDYRDEIRKIARGLIAYQYRFPKHDLNGMYFCWDSLWHNWGNNQTLALLEAYKITENDTLLLSVREWADGFVPFVLENNFPQRITIAGNGSYSVTMFPQIAYGINSMYRALNTLAGLTGDRQYAKKAERVFRWYKGGNVAGKAMYQSETGRCYDGINSAVSINMNSGAESTLECLLSIQKRGFY